MNPTFSLVVIHEGYTTTQKILDSGFKFLNENYSLDFRVIEAKVDTIFSIGENEIPLLVRCGSPWVANFTEKLVAAGKPYLYFIDDDFWSIDFATALGKYYRSPSTLASLKIILSNAHTVLTNTEILANRVRGFNQNVKVIPAYFDFSLLENAPSEVDKQSNKIRIGFASNHSRLPDFQPYENILISILDEFPNCEIDIIGLTPNKLGKHPSVNVFPHLESYEEYIFFQLKRSWDIGLAPLRPSKQNSAKTNNKYREYAAMSIAGIYADEPPYSEIIHGKTGLKVGTSPHEWDKAIRNLIANSDLRTSIVSSGRTDVRNKYGMNEVMDQWFQVLEHLSQFDQHKIVDWNRDEITVQQSKFSGSIYLLRTQGFSKWVKYYYLRFVEKVSNLFHKSSIPSATTIQNIQATSKWNPPRNRFGKIAPEISIVLHIATQDDFEAVQKSTFPILEQRFPQFEVIVIVGSNSEHISTFLESLHNTYANIGIITQQDSLRSESISYVCGYMKSRGKYVIFANTQKHFELDTLSLFETKIPNEKEKTPVCIVAGRYTEVIQRSDIEIQQQTLNIWPIPNRNLELTALIDRRIIETVGLPDPKLVIENFSTFDFLARIATYFTIEHLPEALFSGNIPKSTLQTSCQSFNWKQLEHLTNIRNSDLIPNAISNYVVTDQTYEQKPTKSSLFRNIFKKSSENEKHHLVISIGEDSSSKIFFQYFPEKIRKKFKLLQLPNSNLFDRTILDQVQTVTWDGVGSVHEDLVELVEGKQIQQYLLVSSEEKEYHRLSELYSSLTILDTSESSKKQHQIISGQRKAWSFPSWLSEEKLMRPIPLEGRESNKLTIAVINSEETIDFHNNTFLPNLRKISEELRISIRLIQCADYELHQEVVENHKYLKTFSILATNDAYVTLQRISSFYPDFIISSEHDGFSLFKKSGLNAEAIAAISGSFTVYLPNIGSHQEYNKINSGLIIETELGQFTLNDFIHEMSSKPKVLIKLSENNRTRTITKYSGDATMQTLNKIMNSSKV